MSWLIGTLIGVGIIYAYAFYKLKTNKTHEQS